MKTAIYTLTSPLHDVQAVDQATQVFLRGLGIDYDFCGEDYATYGTHPLDLIFVRTGGTEAVFRRLLADLRQRSGRPFYMLTSGQSNSLAASMEILSFLRQHNIKGEILHGSPDYIARRIKILQTVGDALRKMRGTRLGIVGQPSDWLISSSADKVAVRQRIGVELLDISLQAVIDGMAAASDDVPSDLSVKAHTDAIRTSLADAIRIYGSLQSLVRDNHLQGFTIRCFDLLSAVHNTGCLALAKLNSEGIVAGCEGDIPAMLTMYIAQSLLGVTGFQCNPAYIDAESGEMLLAHCTIPFNMLTHYELDTHFESGIGVGINGYMAEGPVTLFKVSGDLRRFFIAEGTLLRCEKRPNLCRTQARILLNDSTQTQYFLSNPIGNHHILLPGSWQSLLKAFFDEL